MQAHPPHASNEKILCCNYYQLLCYVLYSNYKKCFYVIKDSPLIQQLLSKEENHLEEVEFDLQIEVLSILLRILLHQDSLYKQEIDVAKSKALNLIEMQAS